MYLKPNRLVRLDRGKNTLELETVNPRILCYSQLHGKLGSKEAQQLNRCAVVVIIAGQIEVVEKIIRERIR